jgi:hypothetical protein
MPDPDYKALCAELADELQGYKVAHPMHCRALLNRARAALEAQPEPQGPTAWMYRGEPDFDGERWRESWKVTLDEKLARYKSGNKEPVPLWGRPTIEPVPVSERQPGPEDCDEEGTCWLHQPHPATPETPEWRLVPARYASTIYGTTHWLPYWALPVPAPANTINQNNY